jgi:starvation-inducible DNA-binding protein
MNSFKKTAELDIEKIVTFLNILLADEYALYTKTRNAHWNVNGPKVQELHEFFESQYLELDLIINDVAKRVRLFGHFALGSLKDFLNVTHMDEENFDFGNPKQIIQILVNDHETIIRIIRNDIISIFGKYKDPGTNDFVKGLIVQHEKMAKMLRVYLSSSVLSGYQV